MILEPDQLAHDLQELEEAITASVQDELKSLDDELALIENEMRYGTSS